MRRRQTGFLIFTTLMTASAVNADDWNIDIGAGASLLHIENDLDASEREWRPSLSIGFHRYSETDWRIGTGLEWLVEDLSDWGGSTNIMMWRIGDIDYRISDNVALNVHGGFARYYREQPSYGYGYGAGFKYRMVDNWYLAGSVTRADVDISSEVPTDPGTVTKDDLIWASIKLHIIF